MNNDFKKEKNIALYKQVKKFILKGIESGEYKPGEVIPTERELCEILDVSRYTVRSGIQDLVQDGVLYRVQGSGTYVYEDRKRKRSNINFIGVILNHFSNEVEARIFKGIDKAFDESSYQISVKSSNNNYKKEAELIQMFKNEGVDGLIIMPSEEQKDSTSIFDLKRENFPFVLVDRKLDDCITNCVVSDNIHGGFLVTEHLLKLGHKKIGFVRRKYSETSSIRERLIGYKKALFEYDIDFKKNYVYTMDLDDSRSENHYEDFYNFIKKNGLSSIVVVNDIGALEIIKITRQTDLNIGVNLSLVSFDDLAIASLLERPLTTVAQQFEKMGYKAGKMLLGILSKTNNKSTNSLTQEILPVFLRKRNSCSKFEG